MTDRGIIVADACSLIRLGAGIRPSFCEGMRAEDKASRHYHEVLGFLGKQGFRVIVPEMVSIETAGVLAGEKTPTLADVFGDSGKTRELSEADVHNREGLKQFLIRAKSGKMPGVRIERSNPDTDYGKYTETLREIVVDPVLSKNQKRSRFIAAKTIDRQHYGERACMDVIERVLHSHEKEGLPVFFLSDDSGALTDSFARFGGQVGRLNAKGILGGLEKTGIFKELHIKPRFLHEMSMDLLYGPGQPQAGKKPEDSCLLDTRMANRQNDFPFRREMEKLATELKEMNGDGKVNYPVRGAGGLSRVEHFKKKWGERWTARNGITAASPEGEERQR